MHIGDSTVAKQALSKSEAIRRYYAEHPRAKPRQVVEGLKSEGVQVSAQTVSTVRYMMKHRRGKGRRKAGRAARATPARSKAVGNGRRGNLLASLIDAKKLADRLGGIERARTALKMLERLM
jgi:hypothetical protein